MSAGTASHRRRGAPSAVGVLALILLLLGGCWGGDEEEERPRARGDAPEVAEETPEPEPPPPEPQPEPEPEPPSSESAAPAGTAQVAQRSEDLAREGEAALIGSSLEIPAIGVSTPLVSLGLNADHTMQVPSDFARAGWYRYSPVPGQTGPSIIADHVDSRSGPAVFFRLAELSAGDRVVVRYPDGRTAEFAVDRVEQHPKDAFPHQAVYGDTAGPELRLITCGGIFDQSRNAHRDNIIVYASLAG